MQSQTMNKKKGTRSVLLTLVVVLVVLAGVFLVLPVFFYSPHHHDHTLTPETSLRMVAQSFIVYAMDHDDVFPTEDNWIDALVEAGVATPEELVSPAEDGDGVSYIFVPGQFGFDPEQILIYEDPKHFEEGVLVCFVDAHVEMIDHEAFERMLAEQLGDN